MKKPRELRWTARAVLDLLEIGRFIARDDPAAARAWVDQIRNRARAAARVAFAGRQVPEIDRENIREVLLGSYRVVYIVLEEAIDVLIVFEAHRLLPPGRTPPKSGEGQ
jgi:plasmid stabilization system protein ParE